MNEAVYRSTIRESPTRKWYWRVEIDVRDGYGWNGYADSYAEAVARVHEKLRLADERGGPESSTERVVRAMEEMGAHVRRGSKTLADLVREFDEISKGFGAGPPRPTRPSPMMSETPRRKRG